MAYYDRQPVIYPLHRLLEEILTGEIRVPRFQRPGTEETWTTEQRGDLIDSILKQFPIGTVMLWSTGLDVACFEEVGGAKIPAPLIGRPRRLVLDGHQRLSTLVRLLGPALPSYSGQAPLASERPFAEDWFYDARDARGGRPTDRERIFNRRDLSQQDQIERTNRALPLSIALDRVKVNAWIRELSSFPDRRLGDSEIRRVDELRDAIREYQIPVVTLVTQTLEEATESFSRVNSSGSPMSAKHMVGALAYSDRFDLFGALEQARSESLNDIGWGAVDDTDLLRIAAGLLRERDGRKGHHPARLDIKELANALKSNDTLVNDSVACAVQAVGVFKKAGVLGPEILPYSWQLIVLAIALGARREFTLETSSEHAALRWFWRTTYGAAFQGVNSAIVDRTLESLSASLRGEVNQVMDRDLSTPVRKPAKCDFRTVRTRAALLAMAREQDSENVKGPAHLTLTKGASGVMELVPGGSRTALGNLHIAENTADIRTLTRERLRQWRNGQLQFEPLGIAGLESAEPEQRNDDLIETRGQVLWSREKEFIQRWDVDTAD